MHLKEIIMKIKWINKFSQETGFVKAISAAKKCFTNTFDETEARVFKTEKAAQKAIDSLVEYGEGANNDFVIVK